VVLVEIVAVVGGKKRRKRRSADVVGAEVWQQQKK
jgi:hypothetical protein